MKNKTPLIVCGICALLLFCCCACSGIVYFIIMNDASGKQAFTESYCTELKKQGVSQPQDPLKICR